MTCRKHCRKDKNFLVNFRCREGGRFGMRSAYRVAAPSIRFVPWAALASCWPLPQQLLPFSATGGGRRRCALRIFSGRVIFNFAFVALCGALQTHFHGRGWNEPSQSRLTACQLPRRGSFCGDASFLVFLKASAMRVTAWLPPWGSWRGSA